jgi:hypothetical protein
MVPTRCLCSVQRGTTSDASEIRERHGTHGRGDYVHGKHGGGLFGTELASGPCLQDRGEIGRPHGAASRAGVVAGALAKIEVTTGWHAWWERWEALGLGG